MSSAIILAANERSAITNSLDSALQSDLSYGIYKNYSNLATTVTEILPNSASLGFIGLTHTFKIPKYGKIFNMYFRTSLTGTTVTGTSVNNEQVGSKIFSSIELRTSTRTLCRNDEHVILCRMDAADSSEGKALSRMTNPPLTWTTTAATALVSTPLFFPFFENKGQYLDAYFVEQLYVVAVGNSALVTGIATVTGSDCRLYVEYYNLEAMAEKALVAENFKRDKPLTYLGYNYMTESRVSEATTSTTINLTVNNFVTRIWIYALITATGLRFDLSNSNATDVTVTLKLSGQTVMNAIPAECLQSKYARQGAAGVKYIQVPVTDALKGNIQEWDVRPICIDFRLPESNHEMNSPVFKSGGVSMFNVSAPQIIINHASSTNANTFYVVSEYIKMLSIDPSNGSVLDGSASE